MPAFLHVVTEDSCVQALTESTLKGEHGEADNR